MNGQENNALYFGQKSPGLTPSVFAPGIISKEQQYEFGSVFSKNGKEFFFGVDQGDKSVIYHCKLLNGQWSTPDIMMDLGQFGMNDPMLSPDEQRLYFISRYTKDQDKANMDHDIWFVERTKNGWSEPINAGPGINTAANEYYISFTSEGDMYFGSNVNAAKGESYNYDIYKSKWDGKKFQKAKALPSEVNTNRYEADVFVAPDDSYMIFCAIRREGFGEGDLYISFKEKDGKWSKSKNMGEQINSAQHELCPFVTADGKYLLFTSKKDIYWVDAKIIDSYRD